MALEAPPTWKEIEEDSEFQSLPDDQKRSTFNQWNDYSRSYAKDQGWDQDEEFTKTYDNWYSQESKKYQAPLLERALSTTADVVKSVGRGISDAYMGGSEGLYRAAGSTIAPFDRDEYLNQETQSAQAEIEKLNQNSMMIPEAREAGIRGQQERLQAAQNEIRARQTEGTPEFQQRLEQQNNQISSFGTTLLDIADEGGRLRQEVRQALPVSKEFEASLPGQIAQGLGQLSAIPLYAIPGVGPAVSIGQIYQEGYDDAVRNGANPEQAREAAAQYTAISAPLDIITDKLIVGRALKGMVNKSTVGEAIKDIAGIAIKEGAAEGGQQAALNLVASTLSGYDPDRPLTQDVLNSVLVGTIVGGAGAGVAQVAGSVSRPQEEANVATTVIAENAAAQSELLLNNNAPQTAQAVTENAEQAINSVDRQARTLEILEDLDRETPRLQAETQGDERFAPPSNAIRQAQVEADNLYSEDPDQAGQSSLRDWRLALPPEVAGNIQAHGAPISELQGILEQGIDPERPFYTAPLNESGDASLGLRDIGTGGQVLMLGAPGQDIKQSGVQAVVVNDYLAPSVPQLQEAYPNVTWLTTKNATQWLNEQQPTRLDEPITIPEGQAQAAQAGVTTEIQESPVTQTQGQVEYGNAFTQSARDNPALSRRNSSQQAQARNSSLLQLASAGTTEAGSTASTPESRARFLESVESQSNIPAIEIEQFPVEATGTAEHYVRYDPRTGKAIKVLFPNKNGMFVEVTPDDATIRQGTLPEYLRRIELFNDVFDGDLTIEGTTRLTDPLDDTATEPPSLVVSQTWEVGETPTQEEVANYMRSLGFQPGRRGEQWFRPEDGIYVADARTANFVKTDDGVRAIDLLVTQVTPNETARTDSGAIPETVQPNVPTLPEEPSIPASQGPQFQRVQIGSSPQTHQVIEELPSTPREQELGERYFRIRNERTGEEQTVEAGDMRPIRANLGPGAANIEEPVVQYEERSFGRRLDADEAIDQTLRETIGNKFYSPIPNNVTAEQARTIIAERGIDDSITTIKDESNGIPFHVRSVIGQTIIKNLNQQYTTLKESNPQEAQRILQQTVDLAEWQQDYGTRLGQGIQSFAMWQRLTPEGMLTTYQRGVRKARERYEQANPGEVDSIINEINKAVPKDKSKVIDELAKSGNKTAKKVRKVTDKIIKAGKGKDLTSPEFYDAVSEELGLPKVSPEVSTKILDLATKVTEAPEGIPKDRATLDLTKYIASQKGFKASDLPLGIYYGNILSGYNTHLVNAIDTLGNVNSEIFALALINPRAAAKIYGSLLRGFSEGKADALMALTEGRIATNEKWMDVPKLLEVAQFGTKGGVPIDTSTKGGQVAKMIGESKLATPLNLYKYVGRALAATDAFNFRGVKEAKAAQLAYQIAKNEGKKGQELTDRMDDILGLNKMSGLLSQAKAEGFEGTQATARAVELREQLRDSGIVDASSEFAGEATYNHRPHGALGVIAGGIESVSNVLLPLKLFVPFTRIVANVTNRSLNYTPYGYKRAFMGYTGEDAPIGDAKAMALARANLGTTALGLLGVMAAQGLIEINGAGPSDDEKRKQLMSAGWKPYSIRIGDNYVNYLITPIGLGLSVIGNMIDSQKYNELGNKDAATRAVYALGRIGSTVASQSFISGLSSLFRILSEAPGEAVTAIKSTISGTTSGFTTPTLLRDINRLFDNKLYKSDSIAGDFIRNTPFAGLALKPALNAFGEPVTLPRQRFYTTLKDDASWRTMASKGLRIPVPSKATAAVPGEPGALSSAQYYHYLQESGQELKKYVQNNIQRINSLDQEKAQDLIDKEGERIRKRILPRIRKEKYKNP